MGAEAFFLCRCVTFSLWCVSYRVPSQARTLLDSFQLIFCGRTKALSMK